MAVPVRSVHRGTARAAVATLPALLAFLLLFSAAPAYAHGVLLGHEQDGGVVTVQAVYDNGDSMRGAQVTVYAPGDGEEAYVTGTIDAQDSFLFAPSEPGTWQVEVRDAGHGDTLRIDVDGDELGAEAEEGAGASEDIAETAATDDLGLSPLQLTLMGALGVWGFVGTALFFMRRKGT